MVRSERVLISAVVIFASAATAGQASEAHHTFTHLRRLCLPAQSGFGFVIRETTRGGEARRIGTAQTLAACPSYLKSVTRTRSAAPSARPDATTVVDPIDDRDRLPAVPCTREVAREKPKAVQEACTALILDPSHDSAQRSEFYTARGLARTYSGDVRGSLQDYDAGLRLDPKSARLHRYKAESLLWLGYVEEAFASVKRGLEFYQDDPFAFELLGRIYYAMGDQRARMASLNRAIELDPEHVRALYRRAAIANDELRSEDALKDATRLLTLPRDRFAQAGTDNAYIGRPVDLWTASRAQYALTIGRLGLRDQGEAFVDALIAAEPNPATYYIRATFLSSLPMRQGDRSRLPDAIEALREAIRLDGDYVYAWIDLAKLHHIRNQKQDSLDASENAVAAARRIRTQPERTSAALWVHARGLRRAGRTQEAKAAALEATTLGLTKAPRSGAAIFRALQAKGYWNASMAADKLDRAIDIALTACMLDETCE